MVSQLVGVIHAARTRQRHSRSRVPTRISANIFLPSSTQHYQIIIQSFVYTAAPFVVLACGTDVLVTHTLHAHGHGDIGHPWRADLVQY
jgi:hypothetical protein